MLDKNKIAENLYNNYVKMNDVVEGCPNSQYFISKKIYSEDNFGMGFKEGVKLTLLILLGL